MDENSYQKNLSFGSQDGMSIIEALLSLAFLGISLGAYLQFASNSRGMETKIKERTDYLALRMFLTQQFSCEQTLINSTGSNSNAPPCDVSENGSQIAVNNADGKLLLAKGGSVIAGYRVQATCSSGMGVMDPGGQNKVASVRFFATPETNAKPLAAADSSDGWNDLLEGNDIRCTKATDPGPPIDNKCTAMMISGSGIPIKEIAGPYFRSSGQLNYYYSSSRPKILVRTRYMGDYSMRTTKGRPDRWKMHYVNKNPRSTVGTMALGTRAADALQPPLHQTPDFYVSGGSAYSVPPNPTGANCDTPTSSSPVSIPRGIPVTSVVPACAYWEQKIDFKEMVQPNNWYAAPLDLMISGIDSANTEITKCTTSLQLISPLVLTWPRTGQNSYVPDIFPTMTRFDLLGQGKRVQTGWLGGRAAFLALDRNNKGKIDDGRELFGDATPLIFEKPYMDKNGFNALALYDHNNDQKIDAKDPVFSQLRLWLDDNSDGVSDPWELNTLPSLEVQSISLRYKKVINEPESSSLLTRFVYEATFHGPAECGSRGCIVYDVYFSTPLVAGNP